MWEELQGSSFSRWNLETSRRVYWRERILVMPELHQEYDRSYHAWNEVYDYRIDMQSWTSRRRSLILVFVAWHVWSYLNRIGFRMNLMKRREATPFCMLHPRHTTDLICRYTWDDLLSSTRKDSVFLPSSSYPLCAFRVRHNPWDDVQQVDTLISEFQDCLCQNACSCSEWKATCIVKFLAIVVHSIRRMATPRIRF